jgi:hypothetical protein
LLEALSEILNFLDQMEIERGGPDWEAKRKNLVAKERIERTKKWIVIDQKERIDKRERQEDIKREK